MTAFFILTNVSGLFVECSTDSSFTVFDRKVLLSKASSFLLACLTGLTGFGWIDLAGLTGFSSRTFLRSLPCRGHTCEVALLLEVVGGVGSVNTRLASGINHSNDYGKFPLFWYLLAFNRKKRKENEKTREKREFRHKAR